MVLAGGAVLMVTVTVGRLVVVDVVLTTVRLVFVLVGVGFDLKSVNEKANKHRGKALQQ